MVGLSFPGTALFYAPNILISGHKAIAPMFALNERLRRSYVGFWHITPTDKPVYVANIIALG